jgi:hypothetical protein
MQSNINNLINLKPARLFIVLNTQKLIEVTISGYGSSLGKNEFREEIFSNSIHADIDMSKNV